MSKSSVWPSLMLSLAFFLADCTSAPQPALKTATDTANPIATVTSEIPLTGPTATAIIIQHQAVPGDVPARRINHAADQDSSVTALQRRAPAGDYFLLGQYERPFNAETMGIYYPDLDIQDLSVYQDDIWVFAAITVKGRASDKFLPGNYALELDLDIDGNGDLLVLARQPSTTDWTSMGVKIWADRNGDVGGQRPVKTDGAAPGDGYEALIFDQGYGKDPDLGWVRISPQDPNMVQVAFMRLLLVGDRTYAIGAWAGYDDLQPQLFDFNDHFTQEQAGSSMRESEFHYPVKELSGLDNTCRLAVGFMPTGLEPGICRSVLPDP